MFPAPFVRSIASSLKASWRTQIAEERVPTLAEDLQLCKNKVNVMIELKYYGNDQKLKVGARRRGPTERGPSEVRRRRSKRNCKETL